MGIVLSFILFLIYTSLIFFIKKFEYIGIIFIFNIILMSILRINAKNTFYFILKIMPFIIFTSVLNIMFDSIWQGMLVGVKLILVCNITYIFSQKMTPKKIQFAIEKILSPFKILKINPVEIGIMVSISISFIPILKNEMQNLKYSLISKGFKFNLKNFIKYPNYILFPLVTSILKKTSEIEQSMISRGYMS